MSTTHAVETQTGAWGDKKKRNMLQKTTWHRDRIGSRHASYGTNNAGAVPRQCLLSPPEAKVAGREQTKSRKQTPTAVSVPHSAATAWCWHATVITRLPRLGAACLRAYHKLTATLLKKKKRGGRKGAVSPKTMLTIDMSVRCNIKHQSLEKYPWSRFYWLSAETKRRM